MLFFIQKINKQVHYLLQVVPPIGGTNNYDFLGHFQK